jgi:hypothetical protein
MLIHVRVGLGWAQNGSKSSMGTSPPTPSQLQFAVSITREVDTTMEDYRLDDVNERGKEGTV